MSQSVKWKKYGLKTPRQMVEEKLALLEALKKLVYENNGRYFIGLHGDSDVTDLIGNVIKQAEGK